MKTNLLHGRLPLTTLAASLVFTCITASAQHPQALLLDTSEVRLMVRDNAGSPIRDAKVVMHVMKRGADQGELEVRTDQDGKVEQDIIPIGNLVKLEIQAPGFQAYSTDYQVNALVKNLVVRLKQQPVLQAAVADRPEEVAKNAPPAQPASHAAYKEPQWVSHASARKAQSSRSAKSQTTTASAKK